jgi:hypothetical protein
MNRISLFGGAAVLTLFFMRPAAVEAQASLTGAWKYCEAEKGCLKFAFRPNGDVIEQFQLSGTLVTAYGHYDIRGTLLKIGWTRFSPTQICAGNGNANGDAAKQCSPTVQSDVEGTFHFDGLDSLTWNAPSAPPLRLLRIKL